MAGGGLWMCAPLPHCGCKCTQKLCLYGSVRKKIVLFFSGKAARNGALADGMWACLAFIGARNGL